MVPSRDSPGVVGDEILIRDGAVDVAVPLGEVSVEVVAAEQDLERATPADQSWQSTAIR
ncbi:MAG: hypothetical protein M3Y35_12775 [Actinomycetota bacterium]|nr:hypothetical protein [Actinomycetota bacterium]